MKITLKLHLLAPALLPSLDLCPAGFLHSLTLVSPSLNSSVGFSGAVLVRSSCSCGAWSPRSSQGRTVAFCGGLPASPHMTSCHPLTRGRRTVPMGPHPVLSSATAATWCVTALTGYCLVAGTATPKWASVAANTLCLHCHGPPPLPTPTTSSWPR